MRYVVTGSHGLIGSALARSLRADGHQVTPLVRGAAQPGELSWDPVAGSLDPGALAGADGIVHLAGVGIADQRWTPARQREVRDSRVLGTRTVVHALAAASPRPPVLVSGSAIGYYGDRGDEELDESSSLGGGFLAGVCREWEDEARRAESSGVRVVRVRTGIVQSLAGGALQRQLPLFRLGLGGKLGSGRQWQSWVTLEDEVAAIRRCLEDEALDGPVNLCAPAPVTNADYTRALAAAVHRPAVVFVPRAALAVVLGPGIADEALLVSQRVLPRRLEGAGFAFRHPEIRSALSDLVAAGR